MAHAHALIADSMISCLQTVGPRQSRSIATKLMSMQQKKRFWLFSASATITPHEYVSIRIQIC